MANRGRGTARLVAAAIVALAAGCATAPDGPKAPVADWLYGICPYHSPANQSLANHLCDIELWVGQSQPSETPAILAEIARIRAIQQATKPFTTCAYHIHKPWERAATATIPAHWQTVLAELNQVN